MLHWTFCCTWQNQVPPSTILHQQETDILNFWTFSLELWPWPLPLNFHLDLDLKTGWKTTKCHVKTQFITIWSTLNFDLWPWPTNPSLARVKVDLHAKIKVKDQMVQKLEPLQMDGRTLRYQTYYLPCFKVDKNMKNMGKFSKFLHVVKQIKSRLLRKKYNLKKMTVW